MDEYLQMDNLIERLNSLAKKIACCDYDNSSAQELFAMTAEEGVPQRFSELAENFGMMMMKVEARELRLEQMIEELKSAKAKIEDYAHHLEDMVAERTKELNLANKELEKLANLDGLTRIANRGYFDRFISNEWAKCAECNEPFAIIMSDVDCFKKFNDTYGHQMGDECLKSVAKVFERVASRPRDLAARYGGEEFVVVLPNTEGSAAVDIAENIRAGVEKIGLPHKENPASDFVTISLGVATRCPSSNDTIEDVIKRADEALYRAKESGRNKVLTGM